MAEKREGTCPLCMEVMDLTDQLLKPCKCGYEICVWCWNQIIEMAEKDGIDGLCPACRAPYDKAKIVEMAINRERLGELNSQRKQKKKAKSKNIDIRQDLTNMRVVRRNVAFIVGIPPNLADEQILQKKEFMGQYGHIERIFIAQADGASQKLSSNNNKLVYVTFSREEEAVRCIQAVNGFTLDGKPLKACFGAGKYCSAWLNNKSCGNKTCAYVHYAGLVEDICTKEDVHAVCISKIREYSGIGSSHFQKRSGTCLPPPVDNSRCDKMKVSKHLVQPLVDSSAGKRKELHPNAVSRIPGLPASWNSSPISCRPSYASVMVSHASSSYHNQSGTSSCFTTMEAHKPSDVCYANRSKNQIVSSTQRQFSDRLKEDILTEEPCEEKGSEHSIKRLVMAPADPEKLIEDLKTKSYSPLYNDNIYQEIVPAPLSSNCHKFNQEAAASSKSVSIQFGTVGKTRDASLSALLSVPMETDLNYRCLDSKCDGFSSAAQNFIASSTSRNFHLNGRIRSSDFELKLSASMLEAKNISSYSVTKRTEDISRAGSTIMGQKFDDSPSSAVGEGAERELFSGYDRESFNVHRAEHFSKILLSSMKNDQSFGICEKPSVDARAVSTIPDNANVDPEEHDTISDTLHPATGLFDHLADLTLAQVFGDTEMRCQWNRDESRFSIATWGDSDVIGGQPFPLITDDCRFNSFSDKVGLVEENAIPESKCLGVSKHYAPESSEVLNRNHSFFATEVADKSQLRMSLPGSASMLAVSSLCRVPSLKSSMSTPPGFPHRPTAGQDQSVSVRLRSGSTHQCDLSGGSSLISTNRDIARSSNYADIKPIKPEQIAFDRKKQSQSMLHLTPSDDRSNLLWFSDS